MNHIQSDQFPIIIRSKGLKKLLSKRRLSPQNHIHNNLIFDDEIHSTNLKNYSSAPVYDQIRSQTDHTNRFYGLYKKLEDLRLPNETINMTPSPNSNNKNFYTGGTYSSRYEYENTLHGRGLSPEVHTIEPKDTLQIQKKFNLLAKYAGEPHYYAKPVDISSQRTPDISTQRQNKWNTENRNNNQATPPNLIPQSTVTARNNMKAEDADFTASTTEPYQVSPSNHLAQASTKERLRGYTASPISPRTPTPAPGEGYGTGHGSQWQERVMCKKHPGYMISFICVQERCGELLCQECKKEHGERVHEGEYQTLQNFKKSVALQLNQACDSLLNSSSNIEELQIGVKEKEEFYEDLQEKIKILQENVMNNVQEYFENLKREFENNVYTEVGRTRENLDSLQSTIASMVNKLKQDFHSLIFEKDTPEISLQKLTKIIRESYISSSDDFQTSILDVEEKIEKFLHYQKHNSRKKSKTTIEVEGNLLSNLEATLTKDIRIVKKQSISSEAPLSSQRQERGRPGAPPITDRRSKVKNAHMINQYKSQGKEGKVANKTRAIYQKAKQMNTVAGSQNDRKARTLTPVKDMTVNIPEKDTEEVRQKAHTPEWKSNTIAAQPKRYFQLRPQSQPKNSVQQQHQQQPQLNVDTTEEDEVEEGPERDNTKKNVEFELMEFLVDHMSGVYQSNKVKVLHHGFIEKLLGISEGIDLNNYKKKRLHFERVSEDLQTKGKSKTIFTAYEKVLFLMNVQEIGWTLIEVKRTPKVITLYDFLGRFSMNRYGDNLMEKIFEVIKHEYKVKMNQDVDIFMWERKILKEPCLVEKDPRDTGILVLEIVANAYQDKGPIKGKIGEDAVKKMRQNIEKIIVAFEGNN